MFNISFGELMVIGAIGVIVIGPARLPQTARFVGHWIGRAQRQISAVKADIKREMALEDMKNIHREYEKTARDVGDIFRETASEARQTAADINNAMRDKTGEKPPPAAVADK